MTQWLQLHAFTAKGLGLIPGQGAKIPQAAHCGHKERERKAHLPLSTFPNPK